MKTRQNADPPPVLTNCRGSSQPLFWGEEGEDPHPHPPLVPTLVEDILITYDQL